MTGLLKMRRPQVPGTPPPGAQLLLVDPDAHSLLRLADLLVPVAELAATNSARRALEAIEAGAQFDALICAVHLEDCSARELVDRIERIHATLARRTLVLAGASAGLDDAAFLTSGRVLVLQEPFTRERLVPLVSALVAPATRRRLALLGGSAR